MTSDPKDLAEEKLRAALQEYIDVSGWNVGVLTDALCIVAQQGYTETGQSYSRVSTVPVGAFPSYRAMGLLQYARVAYDSDIIAAYMPPPVMVHRLDDCEDDEDGEEEDLVG